MSKVRVESTHTRHDAVQLTVQIIVIHDVIDAVRQLLLQRVDNELNGAICRAIRRSRENLVAGAADGVRDQGTVVRSKICRGGR